VLFDTNVWIALLLTTHPNHVQAREYYVGLDERAVVLLAQSVRISVLRLLTTPTVQRTYGTGPINNTAAHQIVESGGSRRPPAP
jgi:predicted nucleic acid-binding protein